MGMKNAALCLAILALSSCASVIVSPESRKVRLVSNTPQNCKYLGQVEGHWKDAKTGGMVGGEGSIPPFRRADLKNKAAELGADTLEITSEIGRTASAEAYLCGDLSRAISAGSK